MPNSRDIIEHLNDPERWPHFENAEFLEALDVFADDAMRRATIDGYLAAILIYHQLTEETLRVLIRDSQFLIEAAIHPWKIKSADESRLMFGHILDRLRKAVEFDQKAEILKLAEELNGIRIEFVHGLTKKGSVKDLETKARRVAELSEKIYNLYEEAHDLFRLYFKDLRKDWQCLEESESG